MEEIPNKIEGFIDKTSNLITNYAFLAKLNYLDAISTQGSRVTMIAFKLKSDTIEFLLTKQQKQTIDAAVEMLFADTVTLLANQE